MNIYLIRHGLSQDDYDGISQRHDSPLSETGKQRISTLENYYHQIPFTHIYHSPWARAKQTAELLFSKRTIPMKEIDYIHEYRRPNHLCGVDRTIVKAYWDQNRDKATDPDWQPDDGESFNDILKRVQKFKKVLLSHQPTDVIAVVSHGIFFRHLIGNLFLNEHYNPHIFNNFFRHIILDNVGYIRLNLDENQNIHLTNWHNWDINH